MGVKPEGPWRRARATWNFSSFGLIVDTMKCMTGRVDREAHGWVKGTGYYPDSSYRMLEAMPIFPYRFDHWNDGDTHNPRQVFITQDTSFTAYFVGSAQYTVHARSNNLACGTVTGEGQYYEDAVAVLTAEPRAGCYFGGWADGDTTNPRAVLVQSDTTLVALFAREDDTVGLQPVVQEQLFTLSPNPTSGEVMLTIANPDKGMTLQVVDAEGRTVMQHAIGQDRRVLTLDLSAEPTGVYYIRLVTPRGSHIERLLLSR